MGRLRSEFVARVEAFVDRVLDVVDALAEQDRIKRVLDQLTGSATSVGANIAEADEALSRKDFCKIVGIVLKELSETRFWLRLCIRREWLTASKLEPLIIELTEIRKILGSILARTRKNQAAT